MFEKDTEFSLSVLVFRLSKSRWKRIFFELVRLKLVDVITGRDDDSRIGGEIKKIDKVFLEMCGCWSGNLVFGVGVGVDSCDKDTECLVRTYIWYFGFAERSRADERGILELVTVKRTQWRGEMVTREVEEEMAQEATLTLQRRRGGWVERGWV